MASIEHPRNITTPTRCPLCDVDAVFSHIDSHVENNTQYQLFECGTCRAQFWEPLKNPGPEWYEHDVRYSGANAAPPREPYPNHRMTVSFLRGRGLPKKDSRVLDIGCGTGNFLSWAKENGWHVYGIDFDENAVHAATHVFGLPNVEHKMLGELVAEHPEYAGHFDLVSFFDVFEHIDNHNEFAEQVKLLLKDGGYAAMTMPYRGAARWLNPKDLPPRHLTKWDVDSLGAFWERHGFAITLLERVPFPFFKLVVKFRHKWGKKFTFNLVGKAESAEVKAQGGIPSPRRSLKIRLLHLLAKTKDLVLFGIPAAIVWLMFLPFPTRYTGLIAIVQKKGKATDLG